MKVVKVIADELRDRADLAKIMDAAAEYLESRDTDVESRARATWKLWRGPSGEPLIGLQLDDEGFSSARHFTPGQLAPTEVRELRLIRLWYDVLEERARRQVAKVEKLLSEYTEGPSHGDED